MTSITSLPWTPLYTQNESESSMSGSVTTVYAMALTILFTVFVFMLEHMLDERQRAAYKITKFPEQLEKTVKQIDSDKDDKDDSTTTTAKDAKDDDKSKSKLDTNKPILPQLRAKFTKSQAYGSDKIHFSMISSLYNAIESVLFLVIGFLPYTWDYSVRLCSAGGNLNLNWTEEENEIKLSLVFLLLTTILGTVTALPFELYSTFQIEKKHGFNKMTLGLFFMDKVKSLVLTCVIGGPFVAGLLRIIQVSSVQFTKWCDGIWFGVIWFDTKYTSGWICSFMDFFTRIH